MKKFKIKGKVFNGKYNDLKIIDMETGKELPYYAVFFSRHSNAVGGR